MLRRGRSGQSCSIQADDFVMSSNSP